MSRAAAFRQADVTRAVRGALAAGVGIGRIEIDAHGKIVIIAKTGDLPTAANEWDEVLPR